MATRTKAMLAVLALVVGTSLLPSPAAASACGGEPGDAPAIADVVAAARDACPCDSFASRSAFRRCVRGVAVSAIGSGALPRNCRSAVLRFANVATCGAREGAVACCGELASGRELCRIAGSSARCTASRGGTGRVGLTESCYDACGPTASPAPTPTEVPVVTPVPEDFPTPTGFPTPTPQVFCCACGCVPPYYDSCGGQHQCSMPAPGATTPADCAAYGVAGQLDCAPVFVACNSVQGGIPYPYCS